MSWNALILSVVTAGFVRVEAFRRWLIWYEVRNGRDTLIIVGSDANGFAVDVCSPVGIDPPPGDMKLGLL